MTLIYRLYCMKHLYKDFYRGCKLQTVEIDITHFKNSNPKDSTDDEK